MPTPPSRRDLVDFVAMNSSKVSSVPTACTHQVDTAQDTPPCSSNTAQTELFDSLLDLYQSTSDSSSLECDISAWSAGCILKTNGTNATCSTDSPPIENPQIEHPPHIPRNKSRRYILLKTFDESSCEANGFNVKQVLKPQPLSVSVHPLSDSGSSLASCLDSMQAALAFEQPEIDAQFPCINSALEKRRARSKSIQAEQSHSTRSEGHLMELEEFSPVNNSAICGENLEVARPNANLSIDFCHVALAAEPESITNQCSNMVTRFENVKRPPSQGRQAVALIQTELKVPHSNRQTTEPSEDLSAKVPQPVRADWCAKLSLQQTLAKFEPLHSHLLRKWVKDNRTKITRVEGVLEFARRYFEYRSLLLLIMKWQVYMARRQLTRRIKCK